MNYRTTIWALSALVAVSAISGCGGGGSSSGGGVRPQVVFQKSSPSTQPTPLALDSSFELISQELPATIGLPTPVWVWSLPTAASPSGTATVEEFSSSIGNRRVITCTKAGNIKINAQDTANTSFLSADYSILGLPAATESLTLTLDTSTAPFGGPTKVKVTSTGTVVTHKYLWFVDDPTLATVSTAGDDTLILTPNTAGFSGVVGVTCYDLAVTGVCKFQAVTISPPSGPVGSPAPAVTTYQAPTKGLWVGYGADTLNK